MTITSTSSLDHLFDFIGYGNLNAPVWFLGMEEGGGTKEELVTRSSFKTFEDLKNANYLLNEEKYHRDSKPVIQKTWGKLCRLMLKIRGHQDVTLDMIRYYQANHLGRTGGDTLLLELMPIPKKSLDEWYPDLFPQFKTSEDYYKLEKPRRIEFIKKLIKKHKPKLIIAYGKRYWPDYKALFPRATFASDTGVQWVDYDGTRVILTDHFSARTMNGENKINNLIQIINKDNLLTATKFAVLH